MEIFTIVIIALAFVVLVIFLYYVPFLLWVSAQVSGVRISLVQLFLMRIRKVPPHKIVDCMIEAHKAGLKDVTRDGLGRAGKVEVLLDVGLPHICGETGTIWIAVLLELCHKANQSHQLFLVYRHSCPCIQ